MIEFCDSLQFWKWVPLLFALAVLVLPSDGFARDAYARGEVLVTLSPEVQQPAAWALAQKLSVLGDSIRSGKGTSRKRALLRVGTPPEETVVQAIARLKRQAGVIAVQPNYIYRLCETIPDDPSFSDQWALRNVGQSGGVVDADIDATNAWDMTTGSADVLVAVIDTGVDYNHADLSANLWTNALENPSDGVDNDSNGYIDDWRGWDFQNDDNDPWDDHSHGTHVSGIIGALGNNGTGVSGICWQVRLIPLDAFDASGESLSSDLIDAIDYARQRGAWIINASWGDQYDDPAMLIAIREFTAAGGLFVCAAGNEDGEDNDWFSSYPANFDVDALLSVAANRRDEQPANFSSIGANRVHLFAPGAAIYNTFPGGYGNKSGTSMASPMVAGTAALLWAWDPSLSNLQVKYRIMAGADSIGAYAGKAVTGGRLNAAAIFGSDTVAPAPVSNLTVTETDYDRLNLIFTVSGDDGMTGTARFLDVRYSTVPITEANWESATRAYDEPAPAAGGTLRQMTLPRLEESTEYFVRMKVIDDGGNLSPLSNEAVGQMVEPTVLFSDDVESGIGGWTVGVDSRWARSTVLSKSGDYCWEDSPLGEYDPGGNDLISPPLDLSRARKPVLRFWHRYDIEPGGLADYGEVQASTDGVNWTPLARYWDGADWWLLETLDLAAYQGYSEVYLRFHFFANGLNYFDGWYVDDVRVLDVESTTGMNGWEVYGQLAD